MKSELREEAIVFSYGEGEDSKSDNNEHKTQSLD